MPIRVVLAEDNLLVREGLQRLLEARDELEVVAVCGDLDSLLAAIESTAPDVVVTRQTSRSTPVLASRAPASTRVARRPRAG